ncbi:MAG: cell wall-binding repeat-containing protein, partial [Lachnospiraceae bacterium]|nr:cell wall-binding repeat-containing protein [Lachnospiraceae bacterium]
LSDTVIITTGYNYADALSISPYAYASKTPILLTNEDGSLRNETKAALKDGGFKKVIIVGGTAVVSEETEEYLKQELSATVLRLYGTSRYKTSAEIIRWELGLKTDAEFQPEVVMTTEGMGVARADEFADALSSVSLLGKTGSVLLLLHKTEDASVDQAVIDELIRPYAKEMTTGYIFGGTAAISEQTETLLNETVKSAFEDPANWIVPNLFESAYGMLASVFRSDPFKAGY